MLRQIKCTSLQIWRGAGIFRLVRDSEWRRQRLLILCYHCISLEDEHQWRPELYMQPELLEQRLLTLRQGGYQVLPLSAALRRLYANELPHRSVTITFDDGSYDFYEQAYPRLKKYGFPATVYQSTYYSEYPRPIFHLICSYMLWKSRNHKPIDARSLGFDKPLNPGTEASREAIVKALIRRAGRENQTGTQKDKVAAHLAELLGIDYEELVRKRTLQLMNAAELAELAQNGVDFQLHTHRHCTPVDEALFRKEILDNRESLRKYTGTWAVHFCYPSGVYQPEFLPWLEQDDVISATTCDPGLATRKSHPLLLPRYIDTSGQTNIEFESWLTGVGEFLVRERRRSARRTFPVGKPHESEVEETIALDQ